MIKKKELTTTVDKPGTGYGTVGSISAGTLVQGSETLSESQGNSSRVVVNVMRESLAIKGSGLITGK